MERVIKKLPQELINKIAAGEVVERPASIVKELVENSIDAGAKNISIEIENGGMNMIKVTDDGLGMNRENATLSISEHATSKIQTEEDLFNISTLGFRGEALSSISAVSDFSLITRDSASTAGTKINFKDNQAQIADIGCPVGTSVSVRDLFYNVPARKKFLKTPVTEFSHVVDLFFNYCLFFPQITWKLSHNGKVVYHFPETTEQLQRLSDVFGGEIGSNLIKIDFKSSGISVNGFIGKPQIARNNRKLQYLAINNRPVNDFIIAKQVKDSYLTLIARDLYPVYVLNVRIENNLVDVNVHPRKLEVRFSEPQIIYRTIYSTVSRTLDENDLVKQVSSESLKRFVPIQDVFETRKMDLPRVNNFDSLKSFSSQFSRPTENFQKLQNNWNESLAPNIVEDKIIEEPKNNYRILGQLQNQYIVVEIEKGIRLYDQHATHERIQYEKIKRQWLIGAVASQKMLIPLNIELTVHEGELIYNNQDAFTKLGFEITNFGGNTFVVGAIPSFFVKEDIKEAILEIIGELSDPIILDDSISEPLDKIFKLMACKSAIKFGDPLTPEESLRLITDLDELDSRYTCVHGRPCLFELNYEELAKIFKRR